MHSKKNGFTIVELLIVMFVLTVLLVGYFTTQKKIITWRNTIRFETKAETLSTMLKAYYSAQLNSYQTSSSSYSSGAVINVLPVCSGSITSSSAGNIEVCTANASTSSTGKNTHINYSITTTYAQNILASLASFGAGANTLSPYDDWHRPIVFVLFHPKAIGGAYCPITDQNSAKVIIISLGSDGILNLPSGASNATTFLAGAFTSSGGFNPTWSVQGDDISVAFSMDEDDLKRKDMTVTQLNSLSTILKNKYFESFYHVLNAQIAGVDATRINYFSSLWCDGSCSMTSNDSSTIFNSAFGLTLSERKDAYGNYICLDSDTSDSLSSESCQNYTGAGCYTAQKSSGTLIARVYSPCALAPSNRVNCSSHTGDLWTGSSSISVIDSSFLITVGGMY